MNDVAVLSRVDGPIAIITINRPDTLNALDIPTLEQDKSIKVLKQPGMNCRFISMNTRKAPFLSFVSVR